MKFTYEVFNNKNELYGVLTVSEKNGFNGQPIIDDNGQPKMIINGNYFVAKFVKSEYDADEIAILDEMADKFILESLYESGKLQPEDV